MSQPEMTTDSSGDSDFVQLEAPDSSTKDAPLASEEVDAQAEPESLKEAETGVSSSSMAVEESVAPQAAQGTSSCCSLIASVPPCVSEILYWRNPVQSGLTFGTLMALGLLVRSTSVLSVATLLALCMLIVAFTYRTFCAVVQTFQKRPLENPFEDYLSRPLTLPEDKIVEWARCGARHVSCTMVELRRLLTVQSIPDSIRFGIVLYIVYIISGLMSIWTMVLLDLVLLFVVPRLYEEKKVEIDRILAIAQQHISVVLAKGRAVPYLGQILPKEKTA